jgi:N-acetylmuramidase-like protein
MTTLELQRWLNGHGAQLSEDGAWGPKTRAAVIETFRNTAAPAVTPAEVQMIADTLGAPAKNLRAVATVESAGGGWNDSGLLKCLWERHYLWRRVRIAVPFLSNPSPGGYTVDADNDGVNDSWEKLADATGRFGFDIAAECASFGKFQIMGAHWKALGYPSVINFVWRLSRSEFAHHDAFARFIKANGLIDALRRIDGNPVNCLPFARGYNGKGQQGYDGRIARAWRMER